MGEAADLPSREWDAPVYHGIVIADVLDRDRLASTKRRGKTATGRPAHQVRYSAEAQQRRQLKLAKPMLSSLRASASVVVA